MCQSNPVMFRTLTPEEVEQFREHAQRNDPPSSDWTVYHPVCRQVWRARGLDCRHGEAK